MLEKIKTEVNELPAHTAKQWSNREAAGLYIRQAITALYLYKGDEKQEVEHE